MVACKDIVKLKQLDTRLGKFSGFFDLAFTVGWSFVDKNDLYKAMMGLASFGSGVTCNTFGQNLGKFFANLLEAKTPNNVFYNEISNYKN